MVQGRNIFNPINVLKDELLGLCWKFVEKWKPFLGEPENRMLSRPDDVVTTESWKRLSDTDHRWMEHRGKWENSPLPPPHSPE
jgi:hypothetical protein